MAAAVAALALAACGGSDDAPGGAGLDRFGSAQSLQLFTCADWRRADPAERREVVRRLREIVGGPVTGPELRGARGTVLGDDQAQRLFDAHCARDFARAFTLYKLYAQAAGFAGRAP